MNRIRGLGFVTQVLLLAACTDAGEANPTPRALVDVPADPTNFQLTSPIDPTAMG